MALQSPGVQVTIIDESFYTAAEPGTTPLIVVATAQDKTNAAGTGTAAATIEANAGKAFKVTSQRDLVDLFGVPFFEKTASGSPIHGGERNEYGLLAAYSFLGASNAAFIVRANVNLDELQGTETQPGAAVQNGDWWLDTKNTSWGIQEWNGAAASTTGGQKFSTKVPLVLTDADVGTKIENNAPKASVGSVGDYAVVVETVGTDGTFSASKELVRIWFKSPGGTIADGSAVVAGQWVLLGSPEWVASWPTVSGSTTVTTLTGAETFDINGTTVDVQAGGTTAEKLADIADQINIIAGGLSAKVIGGRLYIYTDGITATTIEIEENTGGVLDDLGITAAVYNPPALQQTPHTSIPLWKSSATTPRPTGAVWLKTTEPNSGARWRVNRWNSTTQAWASYSTSIYSNGQSALYYLDRSGGGIKIPKDSIYVQYNAEEDTSTQAKYKILRRASVEATTITSVAITDSTFSSGNSTFVMQQSYAGSLDLVTATSGAVSNVITVALTSETTDADVIAAAINAATFNGSAVSSYVEASVSANNELIIKHKQGGDIRFTDGTGTPISKLFGTGYNIDTGAGTLNFYAAPAGAGEDYIASNWIPLASDDFKATGTAPLADPEDGQLWYNLAFGDVDMMYHNGTTWVSYRDATAFPTSDPAGPQVAASMPTTQSDGTSLVTGDLWISTADMENFPTIYKYDNDLDGPVGTRWALVDKTDQTSEDGVLFADARFGTSGATGDTAGNIVELLTNNYLDPDAPDADLYPRGMLLWNLRRSGGNVKKYTTNYINRGLENTRFNNNESMAAYATTRWVTASANNEDGSGSFGRNAQRKVVVSAMKSVTDTSAEIRDEERRNFNLISAPGYPELLSNLNNLNIDRGMTAFVVGDTPLRLRSDATTLTNYGTNAAGVVDNSDEGIVTYDEYCAVYYPNGFTTDLSGANAVVPASHMMLRTIALSDQVSYPWFAPAGTRRGGITNATSVGYIDATTGEFQTVALNEGQRDTLYDLKINPIPFFVGVGLVAYGQKTRARNASALDRINVARLVVYLRSQLNKLARPYIFEPNDKITRDEVKQSVESLLLELVGLRALYDFAVVCDESNNTPARVDRSELWVDVAIEPVKAVEFIYIPVRLVNTGAIKAGTYTLA